MRSITLPNEYLVPPLQCDSCGYAIYHSNKDATICNCRGNDFQKEYELLCHEIKSAENASRKLKASLFRQTSNAYGFGSNVFSGLSLIFDAFTLTAAASLGFLLAPSLLLGGYIYIRGRREEKLTNEDAGTKLLNEKTHILENFRSSVEFRLKLLPREIELNKDKSKLFLEPSPISKLPESNEKRDLLRSPLSYFIGCSVGTLGTVNSIVGIAGCIGVLGGPGTWILSAAIAFMVGIYFAYKRRNYLNSRTDFDRAMRILTARAQDISTIKRNAKEIYQHREVPMSRLNVPPPAATPRVVQDRHAHQSSRPTVDASISNGHRLYSHQPSQPRNSRITPCNFVRWFRCGT